MLISIVVYTFSRLLHHQSEMLNYTECELRTEAFYRSYNIQDDSKRWTLFRTSVFPELYTVCERSTQHLKEEVLKFQIPPLERSPSAQPCSSVSWEQNRYYATQDSLCSWVSKTDGDCWAVCVSSSLSTFSLQRGRAFVVGITNSNFEI
jgi:hypothetical protein